MVRAPTERSTDTGYRGQGAEFLVVNTSDTAREVAISLSRGQLGWTEELTLDGGGYASVATPDGEGPLSMTTETDDDRAVGIGYAAPPMVVIGDRSIDLC